MRPAERWCEDEMKASGEDHRTLVVGLGETGLSVARFLASRGNDVLVIDSREHPPGLDALRANYPDVRVVLESLDPKWLEGVYEVVLSPGLGVEIPIAAAARSRGIPVVSDIELFARWADAPVIGVTGSNGKSTVVTLLDRMLSATGMAVAAGGNLGPAALELLSANADVFVLELSSFQLQTTQSLRPKAAAVLNVSPDHMDRHESFEEYADLKGQLLRDAAVAVFNWDDPTVRAMGLAHPDAIPFSLTGPVEEGYYPVEHQGERWLSREGEPLLPVSALRTQGRHNEANALAALALTNVMDRALDAQLKALSEFTGLPHRCQWVAERAGVIFINDSKGTNVGATIAALEGLAGPFVLIAGGQGKGADFEPLFEAAKEKVLGAVSIGEAAAELEAGLSPIAPTRQASSMPEAVTSAVELAEALDTQPLTVLLSPACASFDMFSNYEERGDAFIAAVGELAC